MIDIISIAEVMPSDGKYKGGIDISLQSKQNNTSIGVCLKNPDVSRQCACWCLKDGENIVRISNVDVEAVEQISPKVYQIRYGKSNLVVAIVFWAA